MIRKLYVGLVLIGVIAITVSCNGSTDELSKEVMGNNSISTESSRAENNKTDENGTKSKFKFSFKKFL